jgi:hypothetical protein
MALFFTIFFLQLDIINDRLESKIVLEWVATRKEIERGESIRVTRVYLDENDPS